MSATLAAAPDYTFQAGKRFADCAMPDFNITAIVLRRMPYGETDNILTLYSREQGRISAIAKGARKAVSRLSGACEVLSHSRFSLASARTLQIVRQADSVASYQSLREDLHRMANALYAADLVNAFVDDGDPNAQLFDLLVSTLHVVAVVRSPSLAARWFELRLLDHLGYAPLLTECVYCGACLAPAPPDGATLSASQGGLLCRRHSGAIAPDDRSDLDRVSLSMIQTLNANTFLPDLYDSGLLERSDIDDAQAAAAMRRYIRFRTDHQLKSLAFLDGLRGRR